MKFIILVFTIVGVFWLGKWYQHFTGPDIYFEKLHTGLRVEVYYRGGGATVKDFVQIKKYLGNELVKDSIYSEPDIVFGIIEDTTGRPVFYSSDTSVIILWGPQSIERF